VPDDAAALLLPRRAGNPGTSTSVTIGMLKTLQNRMNRAALSDASMSSVPAFTAGLIGDDAHHHALDAREADHDVLREIASCTSRKSPVVHQPRDDLQSHPADSSASRAPSLFIPGSDSA
jgi:hypothetical protein